ncbi:MAG: hypothetical protein ABJQ70_05810 [Roseobacter sp.]
MMKSRDVPLNLVPDERGGPAMQVLLSGDADISMGFPTVIGPLLVSGKLRVLATSGPERFYEDIPTFTKSGIEGDIGFMHNVVLAPAETPDDGVKNWKTLLARFRKTYVCLVGRLGENVDLMLGDEYEVLRGDQSKAFKGFVDTIAK